MKDSRGQGGVSEDDPRTIPNRILSYRNRMYLICAPHVYYPRSPILDYLTNNPWCGGITSLSPHQVSIYLYDM